MKIELTDLSPVKKKIEIEVASEEVEREAEEVLRGYRRKARIPGFRPGKAPLSVIRARFAEEVEQDVRERLASRSFHEAARDKGLRPLGDPSLDDLSHEAGHPLRFSSTFEVMPVIEVKGHEAIEVQRPPTVLPEEEVDQALDELRQAQVKLVTEEGREAAAGDVVVADVSGTPEGGETFDRERMQIEVGDKNNLPEFNAHLQAVKAGAEVEFSADYPEDFPSKGLAGKTVAFRLKVHEVKRKELPALDDEFAKDLGDFDDLAALRERIRQDLQARKDFEADHATRQSLLDKLLIQNPVVLPEMLVEHEIRRRMEELVRNMMSRGMNPEKMEIDWKEMRDRQEEPARKAVHARLILDALAETRKIEVEPAAIEERIRVEAQRAGEKPADFRKHLLKHGGVEVLKSQMVRDKTLDYLTSVANIQLSE